MQQRFALVILPLALKKALTYAIPQEMEEGVTLGVRVEVQLGNKRRYAGLVTGITDVYEGLRKPRRILDVLDNEPIIHPHQLDFWNWVSRYYMCTMGEVMQAALPSGLKLQSESIIILQEGEEMDEWELNDAENELVEALQYRNEMSISQVEEVLTYEYPHRVIKSLFEKGVILIKEKLKYKPKPKTVAWIRMAPGFRTEEGILAALELTKRAPKQTQTLLALYDMGRHGDIEKKALMQKANATAAVIKGLEDKNLVEVEDKLIHTDPREGDGGLHTLSEAQESALKKIKTDWIEKKVVLLEGVTGSGKTHIYIDLIKEVIAEEKQALFLLPEIALTTQLIERLKVAFGEQIIPYHSRLNDRERSAIWKRVYQGHPIVLGARSALLLPFKDLGLIVVDEEHDASYKQHDPAPRYNARDAAVMLGHLQDIPVLLGSATPSMESKRNVSTGGFGHALLTSRFHDVQLPGLHIIDMKKAYSAGGVVEHFSKDALERIQANLDKKKQILVFQNRRGYSSLARCKVCGWTAECIKCDVSLTYHKVFHNLRCHYCGYKEPIPHACPDCGHTHIDYTGLGTQKIEDDLAVHFPDANIGRMDLDTARGQVAREEIIMKMEDGEIDILVGTQMVTKGLDFERIGLVVVPHVDQLLYYPDFRTNERAYQTLMQVGGRAGRKGEQGEVVLQTFSPDHRVLQTLVNGNVEAFYKMEEAERKQFNYPPFFRMIRVELKHKKVQTVARAGEELVLRLRMHWKERIIGPTEPPVARIRMMYVRHVHLKFSRSSREMEDIKRSLDEAIQEVNSIPGLSNVRLNVNVDPY
jgi:primosomal protein N' (replication factor Y)